MPLAPVAGAADLRSLKTGGCEIRHKPEKLKAVGSLAGQSGLCSSGRIHREAAMAKGYWITAYRALNDPRALAEYAKLAGPAIAAAGGRFLARGNLAKTLEAGLGQRTVVTEFESLARAIAAYESPAYQAALKVLVPTFRNS